MKVSTTKKYQFTPITLTIEIETEDELHCLRKMIRVNPDTPVERFLQDKYILTYLDIQKAIFSKLELCK